MDLAVDVVNLYKHLCYDKKEFVLSKQMLRSGTSIGANHVETQNGSSRKDFLAKLYISFKESAETMYWFDLLPRTDYLTKSEYDNVYAECQEMNKLLNSIIKNTRQNP